MFTIQRTFCQTCCNCFLLLKLESSTLDRRRIQCHEVEPGECGAGLDARAAAIVMRTVKNTVRTGRTVVCTIHQPSFEIFQAFDELLLLQRGGATLYFGEMGKESQTLIDYFQDLGADPIEKGYNPATWVLEQTTTSKEEQTGTNFAEAFQKSETAK